MAIESLIQGSCIKLLDLSFLVISLDLFALVTMPIGKYRRRRNASPFSILTKKMKPDGMDASMKQYVQI
jgi:hypothetical protein